MKNFCLKLVLFCGLLSALILPALAMNDDENLEESYPSKIMRIAPNINPDPANPSKKRQKIPSLVTLCLDKIIFEWSKPNASFKDMYTSFSRAVNEDVHQKIVNVLPKQINRGLYLYLNEEIKKVKDVLKENLFKKLKENLERQIHNFMKIRDNSWQVFLRQDDYTMCELTQGSLSEILEEGFYRRLAFHPIRPEDISTDEGKVLASFPVETIILMFSRYVS